MTKKNDEIFEYLTSIRRFAHATIIDMLKQKFKISNTMAQEYLWEWALK